MKLVRVGLVAAALCSSVVGCGVDAGSDTAYETESQLAIFFSTPEVQTRKILGPQNLGDRPRRHTGTVFIDGRNLNEDVKVVFMGTFHPFDGGPATEHAVVVDPHYISAEQGAANPDGYLRASLQYAVHHTSAPALGTEAGIFRGTIIATEALPEVDSPLPASTGELVLPGSTNVIYDAEVQFLPNAALTRFLPSEATNDCFGDPIVDVTLAKTEMEVEVGLDGFPEGRPVTVELHYFRPWTTGAGNWEHFGDWVADWFASDSLEEVVETRTIANYDGSPIRMPVHTTERSGWGDESYEMAIEVRAFTSAVEGPYAEPYVHKLTVVDEGTRIAVDQFELCPIDDIACHEHRDRDVPENVLARRNVTENKANQRGLYNVRWSPVSSCSGGNVAATHYSDNCNAYSETSDARLSANLEAAASFELNVNGQGQAGGSLSGSYNGIASGEIQGEIEASFKLNAELDASFETSRTWTQRRSLTTIYDPGKGQIQWWRVVAPRLYYLEVAEFNACGDRTASAEVFLSDLRDSRLVLACEAVQSFDSICHAVEPTQEAVDACADILIDPETPEGEACLEACGADCDE